MFQNRFFLHLSVLTLVAMGGHLPSAWAQNSFQDDIDTAFEEIMQTHMGRAICNGILGGRAAAIQFHLGVSAGAAAVIALECSSEPGNPWVFPTDYKDVQKLTAKQFKGRRYQLLSAQNQFPIESWTDPYTNTTSLLAGPKGISHERLVQLLAHETAVYFDAKANPATPDAQNIPALRDLNISSSSAMRPLVALSDPLTAHTLTYIRALQVEFAITNELIQMHKIVPPADQSDPYLNFLISDGCAEHCLEKIITFMRSNYLPIGLPLLAFAPQFRSLVLEDLDHAPPANWTNTQWTGLQNAMETLPLNFIKTQFTGNIVADLQRTFVSDPEHQPEFQTVTQFLNQDLWPLEWPAISNSRISANQTLLEFLKVPLLSGYNILLSSGPRVRIRPGIVE